MLREGEMTVVVHSIVEVQWSSVLEAALARVPRMASRGVGFGASLSDPAQSLRP